MTFRRMLELGVLGFSAAVTFGAPIQQLHPPGPPPDAAAPQLVSDVAPGLRDQLPRNFRATTDRLESKGAPLPDLTGLAGLRSSGSGEFTAAGLKLILDRVGRPVTIFDLRQEDHGFVNGTPISWYATNNWANVGRSHEAVVASEQARLASIQTGLPLEIGTDAKRRARRRPRPRSISW